MFKNYPILFIYGILLFHIFVTAHAAYSILNDYVGWTIYNFHPIMLLLFTLAWTGIALRNRIFAMVYFSLMFFELAMKLFFGNYTFGHVFGDVLFPIDILFGIVLLMLYRQHFNASKSE